VISILIFLGSIILSYLITFVLDSFLLKITKRTETQIDDKILNASRFPLRALIIIVGSYISLSYLSFSKVDLIRKFFFVLTVVVLTIYLARLSEIFIRLWLKFQAGFERTPEIISKVFNVIIYIVGGLIILDHLGVKITPLIATFGVGGLAIGLALQPTLTNVISGFHITAEKFVRIGDFVEIPSMNISGFVEDIGWRSVKIMTLMNQVVIIPNSKFSESVIINSHLPDRELAVWVQVGVSYTSDLDKVEAITIDVARQIQKTVPGAVKDFEPFIRYHTFGDSNINFTVVLRSEDRIYNWHIVHNFIKALKKRYDQEGIEISWPIRKIYFSN